MARPAGVAGIFAQHPMTSQKDVFVYGHSLKKGTAGSEHALNRHSPYADVAPPFWKALEPPVKPTWADHGAGVVSGGSIDNTYLPRPLTNAWGKARELSKNEVRRMPHKQATDLLLVAKGARLPLPAHTEQDMSSVRPRYSGTIPLFHPVDPLRTESGFIRPPSTLPGAKPPPPAPGGPEGLVVQALPEDHLERKLAYDQSESVTNPIPLSRRVTSGRQRPQTAGPRFMTRAAGLPGGLSLTESA